MRVLALLALVFISPALAQDEREDPNKVAVARAVEALEAAFSQSDPDLREAALLEHRVPAPEVVELLAKGLADKELRVRRAALEALRYTPHEDALEALHKCWKRNREMRRDEELGRVLYRAIGWHGDAKSLDLLESSLFSDPHPESIRARILAMGNIRDAESIERLLDLARKTRPTRVQPYKNELRTSLTILLGTDRGEVFERWTDHWKAVKKDFVMAEKPPRLPEAMQYRWDRFWGIERRMQRGERREDRGRDEGQR